MFRAMSEPDADACRALVTVAYLAAGLLFILSLGGLSAQEIGAARQPFGIVGMLHRRRWSRRSDRASTSYARAGRRAGRRRRHRRAARARASR